MSRQDFYASPFGAAYSAYMERERLSRGIARLLWGGDTRPYYESMAAIGAAPAGATILDCPCGAGPALRALGPEQNVRYLAADHSAAMLARAKRRAAKRGLEGIEFLRADAAQLPVRESSVDLFLSFWGMHCFPDPEAATAEIGRVLRAGGRLLGASFVKEPSGVRQRLLLRPNLGDFGPMCTETELLGWLGDAGVEVSSKSRSGNFLFFAGRR